MFLRSNLIAVGLLSAAIALLLPVSSGPDDDFHLSSIWCSHGVSINCQELPSIDNGFKAKVPESLAELVFCKGRDPSVPTICNQSTNPKGYIQIRSNDGRYPNFFYWLSGLMIFSSTVFSVLAIRILIILVCILYIGIGLCMLRFEMRRKLLLINSLLLIPLPLFFLGTNNPHVISLVIFPTIVVILQEYLFTNGNKSRIKGFYLLSWAGFGCILMMGSRPDGFIYAIFGIFFVFLNYLSHVGPPFRRKSCAIAALVLVLFFCQYFLFRIQINSNFNQMSSSRNGNFLQVLLENPSFLLGILGGRGDSGYLGLGSYDVPLPSMVSLPLLVSWVIILTRNMRRNQIKMIFILATLATLVIQFYGMYRNFANTEGFFQPRYIYIFLVTGVIIYLVGAEEDKLEIPKISIFLNICAGFTLFYVLILRNSSGIRVRQSEYLTHYAGPSDFVSKSIIHWNYFSEKVNGIIEINSTFAFVVLAALWLIINFTVLTFNPKDKV